MAITIFTITPGEIHGDQLVAEIEQATGINVEGRYSFYPPDEVHITGEDVAAAEAEIQAVIDAHVPVYPYTPEQEEQERRKQAETDVTNIPGWATWTEEQALNWHDTNIKDELDGAPTTVTSQNAVAVLQGILDVLRDYIQPELRAHLRLLIALRNETWPNLEGS